GLDLLFRRMVRAEVDDGLHPHRLELPKPFLRGLAAAVEIRVHAREVLEPRDPGDPLGERLLRRGGRRLLIFSVGAAGGREGQDQPSQAHHPHPFILTWRWRATSAIATAAAWVRDSDGAPTFVGIVTRDVQRSRTAAESPRFSPPIASTSGLARSSS